MPELVLTRLSHRTPSWDLGSNKSNQALALPPSGTSLCLGFLRTAWIGSIPIFFSNQAHKLRFSFHPNNDTSPLLSALLGHFLKRRSKSWSHRQHSLFNWEFLIQVTAKSGLAQLAKPGMISTLSITAARKEQG